MKKISILLGVVIMVIITSCNNQSADSNKPTEVKQDEMKDMKMDSMKMKGMEMDSGRLNKHQMMDSSINKIKKHS
jgi:hypothetical protein